MNQDGALPPPPPPPPTPPRGVRAHAAAAPVARRPARGLLPRGLVVLILLRYRSVIRRMVRGSGKRRGFAILGLVIMALGLMPALLTRARGRPAAPPFDPEALSLWLPLALLGMVGLQVMARKTRSPSIFQPADLDMVVPGPFSRRQLILYQLAYQSAPLVLMGFWFGLFIRGQSYPCTVAGVALAGYLIMLLAWIIAAASGILRARLRWLLPVVAISAVAFVVFAARIAPSPSTADSAQWIAWLTEIRRWPVVEGLLLPLRPYVQVLTAPSLAEASIDLISAVLISAALTVLLVALDRGEVEALVLEAQRQLEHADRVKRGALPAGEVAAKRRLGMFPRLGGAGPMAWRQLTGVYRAGPSWVFALTPVVIIVGVAALWRMMDHVDALVAMAIAGFACPLALAMIFRCDFRSDLDHMPLLKTLPMSPAAIVAGQLAAPIILIAGIMLCVMGGLALGAGRPWLLPAGLGIGVGCLPVTVAMVAIDNTVFLIAPTRAYRQAAPAGFDPTLVGRQVVLSLVRAAFLIGTGLLVGAPVAVVLVLGGPLPVAIGLGWCALTFAAAAMLVACTWAYKAFDVTEDLPA
ncbi:MAG: hypothetical protein KF745_09030 [Phycisphaeraceae bacterium]|nr:hypothetical protein [Phycisphaeraceae bacterium]